ncbi:DUF6084 family protein [Amycolatopsis acidiphila]|uniref:Uncharacterized protein n=1 Tax=Amycolatopsis acidiphila TaxID=715473 RepID=A0A558AGA2_9PSEU|nr:DUF6084 family protein [Amycolatopsis acidiphila]TVT23273.1 hypothetical protein FNH06_10280 [Amycolatopsis acidiphila]UIJ56494.1 DUF6084 family protein [Amycolatopsis acidiphila]GHG66963.1 hypothetical protein GCM10017788_25470 [Amycolatopsis acidiphila]
MVELSFDCSDVRPMRFAAGPTLQFRLHVADISRTEIHAIALRCQIRIEPQRRRYEPGESELLESLFGDPSRWGQTLKPFQFASVSVMVPSFTGACEVELEVPCSYDLEVAAGKYFHALRDGVVPMALLFSGTVFGKGERGFWIEQVPWHAEASYRMPVRVWGELMDRYFPASSWIRLHRETVDALLRYKARHAIPTWDAAMDTLLAGEAES